MTANVVAAGPERFTPEQKRLILDTCCSGASESEARALMAIAEERGLNPLLQECYFVNRWDSDKERKVWAVQASIDSFRIRAEASGVYDGQDEPEYEYNDKGGLVLARVKVWRKDWSRPSVGVARLSEYVQLKRDKTPTIFWVKSPHNQLAKCAEALAFRKAFPKQFSKIYTQEEAGATGESAETDGAEPGDTAGAAAGFKTALLNATNSETLDLISKELKEAIARRHVTMQDAVEIRKMGAERRAAIDPQGSKKEAAKSPATSAAPPAEPSPTQVANAAPADGLLRDNPGETGVTSDPWKLGGEVDAASVKVSFAGQEMGPPASGAKVVIPAPPADARDWTREGQELWARVEAAKTLDALTVLGDQIAEFEKMGAPSTHAIRKLLGEKMSALEPPQKPEPAQAPAAGIDWAAQEKFMEGCIRQSWRKGSEESDHLACDKMLASFMKSCPAAMAQRLAKMLREAKTGKLEPELPFR